MFAFFKKWLGGERRPVDRRTRLSLEALEDRMVPSVNTPFTLAGSSLNETAPATASAANGMSVVAWAKEANPGDRDVFAQLFDANQQKVGNPIHFGGSADQFDPAVAMGADGYFAFVWTTTTKDGDALSYSMHRDNGNQIIAGLYGNPSGEADTHPQVAASAADNYVIVSTHTIQLTGDTNLIARRLDFNGNDLGKVIQVAIKPDRLEFNAHVDMAANGRFAIAYERSVVSSSAHQVILARYNANGKLLGKNLVALATGPATADLDVGITSSGKCVVVFDCGLNSGNENVFMRTVSATGALGIKKALTKSLDFESTPDIAMDRVTGDFALAYRHIMADGDHLAVREFFKNGKPKETEHDLGVGKLNGAISLDGLDRFFVAYESIYSPTDIDVKGAFGSLS